MSGAKLVGLMSGTSVDGIDAALVQFSDSGMQLLQTLEYPLPDTLRAEIAALSHPGDNEIERLGRTDRTLGRTFAEAALALLSASDTDPADVVGIGCHGQTIRHRPASAETDPTLAFTLQIGDPNTIAECTGITTVADFRRRDMAAGGEGAPLAPAFHQAILGPERQDAAVVNIGGIANVTLLRGDATLGFDTGPGNTLLDHWIERQQGAAFDRDGAWAAGGTVSAALLQQLMAHPFLHQLPPKSTGKEAFNLAWLDGCLAQLPHLDPRDVQATLAAFTVESIAGAIPGEVTALYVCGGGAANTDLMSRLASKLPHVAVADTSSLGCDPDWVEAAAFAWMAWRTLEGKSGNLPGVTGAAGPRPLGGIYPGNI